MSKINDEDPKGRSKDKPKGKSGEYRKRKPSSPSKGPFSDYIKKKKPSGPSKSKSGDEYPARKSGERSGGKSSEYPKRRSNDYSKGNSSERPERKSNDYPKGNSSERPERKSNDYPKGNSSERPERKPNEYPKRKPNEYPKGNSSERPERKPNDYPKGNSSERPERKSNDYPKRKPNDSPKGNFSDRPERRSNESPQRKPNSRPAKPADRTKVQSSIPHQGKAKVKAKTKDIPKFHVRNKHQERYDFKVLIEHCPELAPFVKFNMHNDESINFTDPEAVKLLNTALLKQHYGVDYWDVPAGYQCPSVPGRADYIHHIAEVLGSQNDRKIPVGKNIKCLDIGVGASGVYPIIGNKEYGWSFIATDVDPLALESVEKIIAANSFLQDAIECRLQPNSKNIFQGIIQENELVDLSICHPPFHIAGKATDDGTKRKSKKGTPPNSAKLNPIGEMSCEGGEEAFIQEMIRESKLFSTSCFWFSTLVAKQSHLKSAYKALEKAAATELKIIPMGEGNKALRVIAWSFLTKEQQQEWKDSRWNAL